MKYDEKTGEKTPENRSDEIQISLEQLQNFQKEAKGLMDSGFEANILLKDISVSLGLIVDILSMLANRVVGKMQVRDNIEMPDVSKQ